MRKALRLGAAALLLVAAGACGGDDGEGAATGSGSGSGSGSASGSTDGTGVVEIVGTSDLKFDPANLTAKKGVEFKGKLVQQGAVPHNISIPEFDVRGADTTTTKDGESKEFSFTPDRTGSFEYKCDFHSGMKGTLEVT